jgi:uncharacterized protein YjdB
MRIFVFFLVLISMTGCIGTDFVDVPLGPAASEAIIVESELGLIKGDSYTLSYKLLATDGSEVAAEWEWSSRDLSVADVDQEGTVIAYEPGQTWVDGVANGSFHDSVLVTVTDNPNAITSVSIVGDTTNMTVGGMRQLIAVLRNLAGDVLTGDVNWLSNDPSIASVDDSGLVSALTDGKTSIVATSDNISSVPFDVAVGSTNMTRTGMFSGRNGYNAMGTAVLETIGEVTTLTLGSDFSTESGPGLYVYLSPNEQNVTGGLSLDMLTSTTGAQAYELPGGADPAQYDYAVIYCQPFNILFAVAPLQ